MQKQTPRVENTVPGATPAPAASTDAALFDKNSAGVQEAMKLLMAQMNAAPAPSEAAATNRSAIQILAGKNVAIVDDNAAVLKVNAELFTTKYGANVNAVHYNADSKLFEVARALMHASLLVFDFDLRETDKNETGILLYRAVKWQCELAQIEPPPLFVYSGREKNRASVEAIGATFILKSSSMQAFDDALLEKFAVEKAA